MNLPREALKWLAFVLMLGDHINAALFDRSLPVLSEVARVVFPIFAIILGTNLAHASGHTIRRVAARVLVWAGIATPFYWAAFDIVVPMNVLVTLGLGAAACALCNRGEHAWAGAVVCGLGWVGDYPFAGPALVLAAWSWARGERWLGGLAIAVCMAGVCQWNGNAWALAAVPILAVAGYAPRDLPRVKWAFYAAYPAHLAVLGMLRLGV